MSKPAAGHAATAEAGLDPKRIPRHVAIIMDGNGRWAKARGLPRTAGHKAGVDSIRDVVRAASDLGVEAVTLYAFSTENWLRSKAEVEFLMGLVSWGLRRETAELDKNRVRLMVSGRVEALSASVRREFERTKSRLADNDGLVLNLAFNYGARAEIVDAVNALIREGAKSVTEEDISRHLYTAGLPDPDLLIRTSGEMRISNFLLWQIAYSEIYVTSTLWPEFRRAHLVEAIADYQKRERRFGGV
ncbi:MAG TPA: isoprenyl transferase [Elusimicrobiota bacterium]|jgi:undecaprenyl diphosphate synthase|nr:isoprenyl transferase [Elusimicrobiota bacterium]